MLYEHHCELQYPQIICSMSIGRVRYADTTWNYKGRNDVAEKFFNTAFHKAPQLKHMYLFINSMIHYESHVKPYGSYIQPISNNLVSQFKHILSPK